LAGAEYEGQLLGTWGGIFPAWVFAALMLSLLVSALCTLDSALASAARLVVVELRLAPRSLMGRRFAMAVFMGPGAAMLGAVAYFARDGLFAAILLGLRRSA